MKVDMLSFGEIEVEGARYDYDLIIEQGRIRKRAKGPSKTYRAAHGHTPLSADEAIPWHGKRLYIGTGMYGALPIMPAVYAAAEEKGIVSFRQRCMKSPRRSGSVVGPYSLIQRPPDGAVPTLVRPPTGRHRGHPR
jgi:hypothetical protein